VLKKKKKIQLKDNYLKFNVVVPNSIWQIWIKSWNARPGCSVLSSCCQRVTHGGQSIDTRSWSSQLIRFKVRKT